jgi:hypothetical protein
MQPFKQARRLESLKRSTTSWINAQKREKKEQRAGHVEIITYLSKFPFYK